MASEDASEIPSHGNLSNLSTPSDDMSDDSSSSETSNAENDEKFYAAPVNIAQLGSYIR